MLPRIYLFSSGEDKFLSNGEVRAFALAEDGVYLGSTTCLEEDIEVRLAYEYKRGRYTTWKFSYKKHYPDGYVLEYVSHLGKSRHRGLQRALARHREISSPK